MMKHTIKLLLVTAAVLLMFGGTLTEARKLDEDGGNGNVRYRLVSLTQWNKTGANITWLNELEAGVVANCSKYYTWGVIGVSSGKAASPDWASHVKVLDFKFPANYTTYATCVAAQPGRIITTTWETGKDRTIFKSTTSGGTEESVSNASYWHASSGNVTDRNATLSKRRTILDAVSSLTNFGQVGEDIGIAAKSADIATAVSFKQIQGSDAYYFYKHGYGGVPALPLYTQVVALQSYPSRTIEFVPVKV